MTVSTARRTALAAIVAVAAGASLTGAARPRRSAPPRPQAVVQPAPPAPLPPGRSPRNANYSIDVELDPSTHTLIGREVLTWRNISAQPASELRFHLYYNAWTNTESTWMRERARGRRGREQSIDENMRDGDWSWIDVSAVRLLAAAPTPFTDSDADAAVHRARRRQSERSDRDERRASARGRAGRDDCRRARVDLSRPEDLRAHWRHRPVLFPRAVVSQDRRPRGLRLERSPVPCHD